MVYLGIDTTMLLILLAQLILTQAQCNLEQELKMNVTEEIKCNGYLTENHRVLTIDGYILQMQRIPHSKSTIRSLGPILLMPGVGCDSASYVDKLENSLAFQLADIGFDVWLGNVRGNKYSQAHTNLDVIDPDFWNFSMDEMAGKDLPAMLNYILNVTKTDKLFYGGTSLGSILGEMLLSSQPEWNFKIKGFLNVLPVSRMMYTTWPLRPVLVSFNYIVKEIGLPNFITSAIVKHKYSSTAWMSEPPYQLLKMYELQGYDPETSLPFEREELAIGHCRSGVSLKTLVHIAQSIGKELCYYNYGHMGNLLYYNSTTPPVYNLSRVTTPVALFVGENDPIADPLDVALLIKDLPNVYHYYSHPYVMFSHHGMTRMNATLRTFVREIAHVGLEMATSLP